MSVSAVHWQNPTGFGYQNRSRNFVFRQIPLFPGLYNLHDISACQYCLHCIRLDVHYKEIIKLQSTFRKITVIWFMQSKTGCLIFRQGSYNQSLFRTTASLLQKFPGIFPDTWNHWQHQDTRNVVTRRVKAHILSEKS